MQAWLFAANAAKMAIAQRASAALKALHNRK
jgi:hypothetical protein